MTQKNVQNEQKAGLDPILHPWSLASIGMLLLNDHYLKYAYASWWTGKISDVAGMIFFPIVLDVFLKNRVLSVVCTGVFFTLSKCTHWGNDIYNHTYQFFFDILDWGQVVPLVMDFSDCLALLILYIPLCKIPIRSYHEAKD